MADNLEIEGSTSPDDGADIWLEFSCGGREVMLGFDMLGDTRNWSAVGRHACPLSELWQQEMAGHR
ncbi:MAG TPA: hypothetical protein VK277_07560 [Acidimicrobiales bacterium]|nr:hypothetical protein [Acidimicrobiales bacterium]